MSLYDYKVSKLIDAGDPPFAALIMAALRKADSKNAYELRQAFPDICAELQARYDAPGGRLPSDTHRTTAAELTPGVDACLPQWGWVRVIEVKVDRVRGHVEVKHESGAATLQIHRYIDVIGSES